jgi:hypothetical protein
MEGERFNDGSPAWLLFDPVRNAYHRLDQRAYEKITQWREEPADDFIAHWDGCARGRGFRAIAGGHDRLWGCVV